MSLGITVANARGRKGPQGSLGSLWVRSVDTERVVILAHEDQGSPLVVIEQVCDGGVGSGCIGSYRPVDALVVVHRIAGDARQPSCGSSGRQLRAHHQLVLNAAWLKVNAQRAVATAVGQIRERHDVAALVVALMANYSSICLLCASGTIMYARWQPRRMEGMRKW